MKKFLDKVKGVFAAKKLKKNSQNNWFFLSGTVCINTRKCNRFAYLF